MRHGPNDKRPARHFTVKVSEVKVGDLVHNHNTNRYQRVLEIGREFVPWDTFPGYAVTLRFATANVLDSVARFHPESCASVKTLLPPIRVTKRSAARVRAANAAFRNAAPLMFLALHRVAEYFKTTGVSTQEAESVACEVLAAIRAAETTTT